MTRLRPVSSLVLALTLSACGSATMAVRTADGGVLTLEGFPADASQKAHELMTARCDGPYTIVSEGDELVDGKLQYRMHFRCGPQPHSRRDAQPGGMLAFRRNTLSGS